MNRSRYRDASRTNVSPPSTETAEKENLQAEELSQLVRSYAAIDVHMISNSIDVEGRRCGPSDQSNLAVVRHQVVHVPRARGV